MQRVTILDRSQDGQLLAVDLKKVLDLIPLNLVCETIWRVSGVECVGGAAAERLHNLSENEGVVAGPGLLTLAESVGQIIDGECRGFKAGKDQPWIVIRAVDSSAYDVETDDIDILARIRRTFAHVREIP